MIIISYERCKKLCKKKGLHVLESTYLGEGILGRFFEPDIILVNPELCDKLDTEVWEKQKKILVLLHEMCHWFKWKEHKEDHVKHDEEACFEFEIICNYILNEGSSIYHNFEAIKRLGLQNPMSFLREVIKECAISDI